MQLCVAITFLDDFAYEENETLNVSLSTADPSVVITTPTVGVTIEDSTGECKEVFLIQTDDPCMFSNTQRSALAS